MRTETKLSQSVEYDRNAGKVLTIVVDVNQAVAVNRNRDFEIPVNSKLREIESGIKDKGELEQFAQCVEHGRRIIQSYRPRAKSLVLFVQANGNVTKRELNVPLNTEARWAETPHIQPLVEAGDEFEEVLIVLLDGSQSRFLTSFLGDIMEHPEIRNPFPTAHTQAPGNDHAKSQPTFHRKSDEHERHYLKSVAEMTERIAATRSLSRIVLAGSNGPCKELYFLLSKEARQHVISFAALPVQATLEQVAGTVAKLQFRAERETESAKVATLLDRVGSGDKAVAGLTSTVEALGEGRVRELIYVQGLSPKGALCSPCGILVVNQAACPKCLSAVATSEEAMNLIIGAALDTGATIEQIRGEAAEKLTASGGIGAFLRF